MKSDHMNSKYQTRLFPQADNLADVTKVVEAVAEGNKTDRSIEKYIGKQSEGRQGRYYRLQAELLGLVRTRQNISGLTELGEEYYTQYDQTRKTEIVIRSMLKSPVFRDIIKFLQKEKTCTREKLVKHIVEIYPGKPSTADRRASSILAWLSAVKLLKESPRNMLSITGTPAALFLEYEKDPAISLSGLQKGLRTFVEKHKGISNIGNLRRVAEYKVDLVGKERANDIHERLVLLMAEKIRSLGFIPRCNAYIDLWVDLKRDEFLFEMKSVTKTNILEQVRKGLSQLYEYRYTQNLTKSKLCLVVNKKPRGDNAWLVDYLGKDRRVFLLWSEDLKRFCPPDYQRKELKYFAQ